MHLISNTLKLICIEVIKKCMDQNSKSTIKLEIRDRKPSNLTLPTQTQLLIPYTDRNSDMVQIDTPTIRICDSNCCCSSIPTI